MNEHLTLTILNVQLP